MGVRFLAAASLLVVAGCLAGSEPPRFLFLELVFVDTDPSSYPQYADPGRTCGNVRIDDGQLIVQRQVHHAMNDDWPLIVVEPLFDGEWVSSAQETYAMPPGAVPTGLHNVSRPVATIGWDGAAVINEKRVGLPHAWSVHDPDGWWRIDARLAVPSWSVAIDDASAC